MSLLLPGNVAREIQKAKWAEQRAEQRALIEQLIDFDDPVCREWQPVLEKVDPFLRLGRARPMAYAPGVVVRPGYYHWVRDNPTTVATVEAITGPDGESFSEPDSGLLEELKRNDLQDPRVYAALVARRQQRELERERELDEQRAEVNQEVLDRWKAVSETSVSMSRDVPWSQNQAGRRGRGK